MDVDPPAAAAAAARSASRTKRPRSKQSPPPSTWDETPPPSFPTDNGTSWIEVHDRRRRWKRKHTPAKRRRWAKREKKHAAWEKKQSKPPTKRKRTIKSASLPTTTPVPYRAEFWTPFCRNLAGSFWLPLDAELVDTQTGETAPTWFQVRTLALPYGRRTPCDQSEAARHVCNGIKTAVDRQARDKADKKQKKDLNPPKEKKLPHTKCKVFFMKPSAEQRTLLSKFMSGARYCHSEVVKVFNALPMHERLTVEQKTLIHDARLGCGGTVVKVPDGKKKKKIQSDRDPWREHAPTEVADVPYIIRKNVARDVIHSRDAWKAKKCNQGQELKLKERSGKESQESFYIEQSQINTKTFRDTAGVANLRPVFGTETDRSAFPSRTKLPEHVDGDCRIVYNRIHDKWKFIMPVELEHKAPNPASKGNVVAIDPGIRVFATCYDLGRKKVVEWGRRGGRARGRFGGTELIEWLCRKTDRLQRREAWAGTEAGKAELHKQANVVRERIRYLVDEFHHKFATWLCTNYEVVVLPKFGVKRMMQRRNLPPFLGRQKRRVIGKKSCRKLAQMSHGRFREFLLHKAREYGTTVVICDERDTTRTCTVCGRIKGDVGADKVYNCQHCKSTYGRDAGAARNILMRYLALQERFLA